ncbi:MAG: rod shape-determining protein RodA [Anaerolineae bacterium]|nr:rod shape-determining protein RodA [Anaerolineae bacterium]
MLRKRLSQTGLFFRNFDYVLFFVVIILIVFGVLMIASATRDVASLSDRVNSQIRYGIIGIGVVLIMAAIDYRYFTSTYLWIYGIIVAILGVVGILGVEGEAGAQSWVSFGVAGFQPSELAKMLLIIVLAQQLALNAERIGELRTILISLGFVGLPVFFIFIQPDLGISVLVLVTWFAMVWGAGMRWRHIALFVVLALIAMPILWSHMEDYQKSRITSFVDIDSDKDAGYNMRQAMTAIGNGGLLGRGYMQGTQSQLRYLRVRHTDFIFAVIAEELGFVGVMLVLVLIAIVVFRILRAARLAQDMAGGLLCYGVAMVIFFQTLVSIGMNIRLLPVTGLTLPFISSGGSSLVTLMFGVGLVESVVLRHGSRQL